MILSWMLYSTLVALLLGSAAAVLETPVHQRGGPVRALWIAAMAGAFLTPLAVRVVIGADTMMSSVLGGPAASPSGAGEGTVDDAALPRIPFDVAARPEFDTWLVGAWITGSTLALLLFVGMHAAVRHRSKTWRRRLLDGAEVWVSDDTGPAVVGFVRPRIVVPTWVLSREARERQLILLHEAEHIRAGDQRALLAGMLALVALPWNVALWWQWVRLRQAVEFDCDRRVLGRGMAPVAYSRLLLDVTEQGVPRRFVAAGLAESPLFLERRIRLMLRKTPSLGRLRISIAALAASVLVIAACSMDQPANPGTANATLWISPWAYHLGTADSKPLEIEELSSALEAALATSSAPTVLEVRNVGDNGSLGYDFLMARIAACEAGVRRLEYDLDISAGHSITGEAERARGHEHLSSPCVTGSQEPDSTETGDTSGSRGL